MILAALPARRWRVELDRSYPASRAVTGHDGPEPRPGVRLPDTPPVEPPDGDPRPLHELTHRPGLTLLVLGGPHADPGRVGDLVEELERRTGDRADAVVGLSVRPGGPAGRSDR